MHTCCLALKLKGALEWNRGKMGTATSGIDFNCFLMKVN